VSKIIRQSVILPTTAEQLYGMYLDPKLHATITGAVVTVSAAPGSAFSAFDGVITGRMLHTVHKHLIVQTWRSKSWKAEDFDSVLILTFWPLIQAGRIDLVHVNVPEHDVEGVTNGWEKFYWTPWRRYLEES
jgi:activator of HSP90 ATPase